MPEIVLYGPNLTQKCCDIFPWVIMTIPTSHSSLQMRSNHRVFSHLVSLQYTYFESSCLDTNTGAKLQGKTKTCFSELRHAGNLDSLFPGGPFLCARRWGCSQCTRCTVLGVFTNLTAQNNCSCLGAPYHLVGRQSTRASETIGGSHLRLNACLCSVFFIFNATFLIHVVKSLFSVQL